MFIEELHGYQNLSKKCFRIAALPFHMYIKALDWTTIAVGTTTLCIHHLLHCTTSCTSIILIHKLQYTEVLGIYLMYT